MPEKNDTALFPPPPELLVTAGIANDDWDALIVGDGSGSRYGWPGGWAAVLYDRKSGLRKQFYGALSDTTVNVMELSPYIYAMMWYSHGPGQDLLKSRRATAKTGVMYSLPHVHILTDCEVIAKQGNRTWSRDANAPLWRAMEGFTTLGYRISWHFADRDTSAANRLCDALSKAARRAVQAIVLPDPYDDRFGEPRSPDQSATCGSIPN
jgi:ribonuclease HI